MYILLVGGTWAPSEMGGAKKSGFVEKCGLALQDYGCRVVVYNGGDYEDLPLIAETAPDFDAVLWWPNVSNDLPKIRDIKENAPRIMLVNSKRNDNEKYSFMELVQRSLAIKANLTVELKKNDEGKFDIMVFDPLGCAWYNGQDIRDAMFAMARRLDFLRSITRQATVSDHTDKSLVLSWYFDRFKQEMYHSDAGIPAPDEERFIALVKRYAERFHEIMKPANNVVRFLGNASMRPMPPQVGRCSKGMPSFRCGKYIFVSQRNVNKEFIDLSHFVPTYLEDEKVYYCGENKPSVDTPIQLRLYAKLPNINYMIHSHCYVEGAPFTTMSVPCGAIEEVEEVLTALNENYGDLNGKRYILNLIGHGSLIMGERVDDLEGIVYYGRQLPEIIES